MKPLQKFHFNLVTPLILDSPATLPEGPWGGPRMPATVCEEVRANAGRKKGKKIVRVFIIV